MERGQAVTLSWEVKRAVRTGIAGVSERLADPGQGAVVVQPDRTTTYTLVAENDLARVERSVTVRVR